MRKILALILALSLPVCMGMAARASTINENTPEATCAVEAVYRASEEVTAISVDIEWEGMSFTYTGSSGLQWDAEEHSYLSDAGGGWEPSNASVTIINHSNTVIQANIRYEAEESFSETELYFTDTAPIIGSAEISESGSGSPCAVTIKAIPGGRLAETATSATRIGTITVNVRTAPEGSDMQIAAFERLYDLHEAVVRAGYDTARMERGTVYYPSSDVANEMLSMMDRLAEQICGTDYPVYQRNTVLNELITVFYQSLEICQ